MTASATSYDMKIRSELSPKLVKLLPCGLGSLMIFLRTIVSPSQRICPMKKLAVCNSLRKNKTFIYPTTINTGSKEE